MKQTTELSPAHVEAGNMLEKLIESLPDALKERSQAHLNLLCEITDFREQMTGYDRDGQIAKLDAEKNHAKRAMDVLSAIEQRIMDKKKEDLVELMVTDSFFYEEIRHANYVALMTRPIEPVDSEEPTKEEPFPD
ncbi:MAG: hypothetical protein WCO23_04890 [bacterium]